MPLEQLKKDPEKKRIVRNPNPNKTKAGASLSQEEKTKSFLMIPVLEVLEKNQEGLRNLLQEFEEDWPEFS